jgi:hypothetical protein
MGKNSEFGCSHYFVTDLYNNQAKIELPIFINL